MGPPSTPNARTLALHFPYSLRSLLALSRTPRYHIPSNSEAKARTAHQESRPLPVAPLNPSTTSNQLIGERSTLMPIFRLLFTFRGIYTYRCFHCAGVPVLSCSRIVDSACCALGAWSGAMPYVHVRGIGMRAERKTFVLECRPLLFPPFNALCNLLYFPAPAHRDLPIIIAIVHSNLKYYSFLDSSIPLIDHCNLLLASNIYCILYLCWIERL